MFLHTWSLSLEKYCLVLRVNATHHELAELPLPSFMGKEGYRNNHLTLMSISSKRMVQLQTYFPDD